MLQIYLPIAEMSVDAVVLLMMGAMVGVLSGLFGVGGGFILTPLLMFYGIPPAVAVASQANQIVGSSLSGVIAHWRKGHVDFRMGTVLLVGGVAGSVVGVWVFKMLRQIGQIDLMISLSYVLFLGIIGSLMLVESVQTLRGAARGTVRRQARHNWIHGLPFKMRFRRSGLYISAIPPLLVGFFVGILAAVMGVGGGFIIVPAMIYLLRMPTSVVIGTSMFQIIFVTGVVTLLHAVTNQTVDFILAGILLIGGVAGVHLGIRFGQRLRAEQVRLLLALLVVGLGLKIAADLVTTPASPYSLSIGEISAEGAR